jgi:hypothetical protein
VNTAAFIRKATSTKRTSLKRNGRKSRALTSFVLGILFGWNHFQISNETPKSGALNAANVTEVGLLKSMLQDFREHNTAYLLPNFKVQLILCT